jgi:uncharacterized repeat protein (TIGR03803 family)
VKISLCSILLLAVLAPSSFAQTLEVLYAFKGTPDGAGPYGGLVRNAAGNLYGTTAGGGISGTGTVFKLGPGGRETVLYSFGANGSGDGYVPFVGLVLDPAGNLYGTAFYGGAYGWGTVFKIDPTGKETILHSFAGLASEDGASPEFGSLIRDAAGNLYGTTATGGSSACKISEGGCGTVFKIDETGTESVLYRFTGASDGGAPEGTLVADAMGNLYGTTYMGGIEPCDGAYGCGVIFRLSPEGKEKVLHEFAGSPTDAYYPQSGVVRDNQGNLFGVSNGGQGEVFEFSSAGVETLLHTFTGGFGTGDGYAPVGSLVRDQTGNLYGTTVLGGTSNVGTIFKVDTANNVTVIYSFTGGSDGSGPYAGLILDAKGDLYGTTTAGGAFGGGTIFKLTPNFSGLADLDFEAVESVLQRSPND